MQYKGEYVWALIGRFMPTLVYLVATMVLARFLTPNDFGMIGVLSVFFMVANTLMDAGLGGSLVKEPNITPLDCTTIFSFNIAVGVFLYILIFVFSNVIELYFETEGLSVVVQVLCLIFIVNSLGLVPRALLMRNLQFKSLAIISVVGVIIAALTSILMAFFRCGVYSLVAYQIVNAGVCVVLSFKVSGFKIGFKFSINNLLRLIPFGLYTTFTTIIDTIYENLLTFLFGKYMNMQQAGYVYQAKRLEEVPSQAVAQTISAVSFPVLTKIRDDSEKFANECVSTFKTILLVVLPLLCTMSIFSEFIISVIFGKDWLPASSYLSLLVLAAVFHIAESLNRVFIKSTTQVSKLLSYTIIKRVLGIAVILSFLFVDPKTVLWGYIISTFIGYILNVHLLARLSEMSMKSQLFLFASVLLPSIVFYIIMIVVNDVISNLPIQLSICVILLTLYYFVILKMYHINITGFTRHIFVKSKE